MTDPQTNDSGEIALKCYPMQQVLVQNTPSKTGYLFVIRANIALVWVKPEDVDNILARRNSKKCGTCGNNYTFMYANEDDVRRWQNGGGR